LIYNFNQNKNKNLLSETNKKMESNNKRNIPVGKNGEIDPIYITDDSVVWIP
jgi:hypothetical protein